MDIYNFPKEILYLILSNLDADELVYFGRTCKEFYSYINNYATTIRCYMCDRNTHLQYDTIIGAGIHRFCKICSEELPSCELCSLIYLNVLDLKMMDICGKSCFIKVCRKQCDFECYRCHKTFYSKDDGFNEDIDGLYEIVCKDCVTSLEEKVFPITPKCSHFSV